MTAPNCQQAHVADGTRHQVAREGDTAAYHIEAEQQHDERDVLGRHSVVERRQDRMPALGQHVVEQRQSRAAHGHDQPVEVVLPPAMHRRQQRQHRDAPEQQDERHHADAPERRHLHLRPVLRCVRVVDPLDMRLLAVPQVEVGDVVVDEIAEHGCPEQDGEPPEGRNLGTRRSCFSHASARTCEKPGPGPGGDRRAPRDLPAPAESCRPAMAGAARCG